MGPGEQQLLDRPGVRVFAGNGHPGNDQITCGQHIGANPTGERIEYRCRTGPREAPHGARGQDRNRPGIGIDRRCHRRPTGRVVHRRNLAPHPHAKSGSVRTSARQQTTAAVAGRSQRRSVSTVPAPESVYPGTASATHFCPSRSTPRPGAASTTTRSACRPGPVARTAGTITDTAASVSSGTATGRRATVGSPIATMASSTTADATAALSAS